MITAGYQKYNYQVAQDRVIDFLNKHKETPHSIDEISYVTHLTTDTVRHVLQDIRYHTELCQTEEGYYFPVNKMRWYLAGFGLVIACTYIFCELIKYYHI